EEPHRGGHARAREDPGEHAQHDVPGARAPLAGATEVEADEEREPAQRDLREGLEGHEELAPEDAEHARAEDEAERDVLDPGREPRPSNGAPADEERPQVRQDEQPHEEEDRVHDPPRAAPSAMFSARSVSASAEGRSPPPCAMKAVMR